MPTLIHKQTCTAYSHTVIDILMHTHTHTHTHTQCVLLYQDHTQTNMHCTAYSHTVIDTLMHTHNVGSGLSLVSCTSCVVALAHINCARCGGCRELLPALDASRSRAGNCDNAGTTRQQYPVPTRTIDTNMPTLMSMHVHMALFSYLLQLRLVLLFVLFQPGSQGMLVMVHIPTRDQI